MESKLLVLVAALSALVALTEAGTSVVTCDPVISTTFGVGQSVKCTCSGTAAASANAQWKFGGAPVTGTGTFEVDYTHTVAAGDNGKKFACINTHSGGADTETEATLKTEDPIKPEIKCDPAKVAKDAESTCTCTNKNTVGTVTKYTFKVDGGAEADGDQGTNKDGYKVKITKEAKVTCMVYFSATVKTPESAEAKIELSDGGSGSGSGASGLQAVPLAVMIIAFIVSIF